MDVCYRVLGCGGVGVYGGLGAEGVSDCGFFGYCPRWESVGLSFSVAYYVRAVLRVRVDTANGSIMCALERGLGASNTK